MAPLTPPLEPMSPRLVRAGSAGFSLLEMLVVLAVIGMVTAASTTSYRGAGPTKMALQPAAGLIAADLRSARVEAMQRSRVVEVRFDGRARSYLVQGATAAKRVPDNIGFAFSTTNDGLRTDYADRLLFFPDGSSTGGALTLSSAGTNPGSTPRTIVLSIDWLTGTVRELRREMGNP